MPVTDMASNHCHDLRPSYRLPDAGPLRNAYVITLVRSRVGGRELSRGVGKGRRQ